MANKTTGQKSSRVKVKNLKGNAKELTAKEQKKVNGGRSTLSGTVLLKGSSLQHNETLVRDSTR